MVTSSFNTVNLPTLTAQMQKNEPGPSGSGVICYVEQKPLSDSATI